jgi:putative membrane protein
MAWVIRLLISWAISAAALGFAAWVLDSFVIDDFWTLVLASAVFGIVNFLVKPILTFIALPLIILTLGIAYFFVNMAMLAITDWLIDGFDIEGFWTYVGATILVWLANTVLSMIPLGDELDRRSRRFSYR